MDHVFTLKSLIDIFLHKKRNFSVLLLTLKNVRYCVAIWVMDQINFFWNYRQTFQCHQKH